MLSGVRLRKKHAPLAITFGALASSVRLSILYLLKEDPMEVRDIVDRLKLPPPLVAHHLHVLKKSGLVTKTKVGKLVTYYLDEGPLKEINFLT